MLSGGMLFRGNPLGVTKTKVRMKKICFGGKLPIPKKLMETLGSAEILTEGRLVPPNGQGSRESEEKGRGRRKRKSRRERGETGEKRRKRQTDTEGRGRERERREEIASLLT